MIMFLILLRLYGYQLSVEVDFVCFMTEAGLHFKPHGTGKIQLFSQWTNSFPNLRDDVLDIVLSKSVNV